MDANKLAALDEAISYLEASLKGGGVKQEVEKDVFYKPMGKTSVSFCGHSGYYMSGGKMYRRYAGMKKRG